MCLCTLSGSFKPFEDSKSTEILNSSALAPLFISKYPDISQALYFKTWQPYSQE